MLNRVADARTGQRFSRLLTGLAHQGKTESPPGDLDKRLRTLTVTAG